MRRRRRRRGRRRWRSRRRRSRRRRRGEGGGRREEQEQEKEANEKQKYCFEAVFHSTSAPNTGVTKPSSFPNDLGLKTVFLRRAITVSARGNLKCCVHDVMSLANPVRRASA